MRYGSRVRHRSVEDVVKGGNRVDPTTSLRADRRTAICAAVFELLGEVGYDRMTMDAVAARARASKATIYRSWPTKPDLVAEALAHHFGETAPPMDTGCLRGDLLAIVGQACVTAQSPDGDVISGLMTAAARHPELSRTMQSCVYETKHALFQHLIDRAASRGELCPGTDAEVLHEVLYSLVLSRRTMELGPMDGVYAEHVVDRVLLPVLEAASRRAEPAAGP
jgi:AcrR family transcriptional regulator